jgi:hypothetical protein
MKYTGPMYDPGVTVRAGDERRLLAAVPDDRRHRQERRRDDAGHDLARRWLGRRRDSVRSARRLLVRHALAARLEGARRRQSASPWSTFLGDLLGERLGRIANNKLTVGSGTGEPTASSPLEPSASPPRSPPRSPADEVIDLEHSVDPAYRERRARASCSTTWCSRRSASSRTARAITSGRRATSAGRAGTFNGRNYLINQDMPSAFTTGQKLILFGDLK